MSFCLVGLWLLDRQPPKLSEQNLNPSFVQVLEDRVALGSEFCPKSWHILAIEANPPQIERPPLVVALAELRAQVEEARIALGYAKCSPVELVPHFTAVNVV
jgi:hypothetical protein